MPFLWKDFTTGDERKLYSSNVKILEIKMKLLTEL